MNPKSEPSSFYPPLPSPFIHTTPPPTLITQGAEAHLFRTTFLTPNTSAALKIRPSKPYRHPTLDARLTKQRVLAEARILAKLSGLGIGVPALLSLDWNLQRKQRRTDGDVANGAWLLMEWIDGRTVKDLLREYDVFVSESGAAGFGPTEKDIRLLMRKIGRTVGAMHSKGGVVHGDLTSSNIMVRPIPTAADGDLNGVTQQDTKLSMAGEIVLIDFGLATQSIQDEDRAVDLYVLERAFGSTHPKQEGLFAAEVLESTEGYRGSFKGANVVLKRLEEVRMRGRKRSMLG